MRKGPTAIQAGDVVNFSEILDQTSTQVAIVMTSGAVNTAHANYNDKMDGKIPGDERHLDGIGPLAVELLSAALGGLAVVVLAFRAVCSDPSQRFFVFFHIVGSLAHPSGKFRHIDRFDAHTEVALPEIRVDHRSGDSHRGASHREIGLAAHIGDGESGTGKVEEFFHNVLRQSLVTPVLDVLAVDPESGDSLLGVPGKDRC